MQYYGAEENFYSTYSTNSDNITLSKYNKNIVLTPENPVAGFIFYPGACVNYDSYIPLMYQCALKNIQVVIVNMPENMAILDVNAADGIPEHFSSIEKWYVGGHSMGGAMAASYIKKHTSEYEGLILLAAYSTADLSSSGLKVLSVYGSEDKVLSAEKYAKYKANLPEEGNGFTEKVIEGGNHGQFGNYGEQAGDGTASISSETQQLLTAQYIYELVTE